MLSELGRYGATVLGAYAITFVLVGGLVALTLRRGAAVKRRLAEVERIRRGGMR